MKKQKIKLKNKYLSSESIMHNEQKLSEVLVDSYSLNEVKTNKIWIDGKPIYRKVYDMGNLLEEQQILTKEFDIPDYDKITFMYGVATNGNATFVLPSAFKDLSGMFYGGTFGLRIVTRNTIQIQCSVSYTGYNVYVIVEYTKNE